MGMINATNSDPLVDLPFYCEKGNLIGSLANVSALLMAEIPHINWVGFYLYDGKKLVLGPFQGRPACTQILIGKGVCGTAALQKKTLRIADVEQFPGHIVCDSRSQAELVVPLLRGQRLYGVLDVDSPQKERFTAQDQIFFEKAVQLLMEHLDFTESTFYE